jgi:hypothetical protein
MSSSYCPDIHHNLAIDYVNGKTLIGPCCQSGRIIVEEGTVRDHWNHPQLKKLREQDYLDPTFCNSCIMVETAGAKSRRQGQVEFYKDWNSQNKKLRGLDIRLGNLCNLKCTICSPAFSTAWISDAKKLGLPIQEFSYYEKNLQFDTHSINLIKNLELIHFWGGEPLIDDKHAKILEFLDRADVLKNCKVQYNTNGTHKVDDNVLDLWSKAKLVEIYFSIDDIGDRFEYQRYPAKWIKVVENLSWYKDKLAPNHLFNITCTISYLNIWYLSELIDWKIINFNSNRLGDIIPLSFQPANGSCEIDYLSPKLKKLLLEKFCNYPELLPYLEIPNVRDNHEPKKFLEYIDKLDVIRDTNWSSTFNEFSKIL